MMITSTEQGVIPRPRQTVKASARRGVESTFTELGLPSFISQILGQYQDLLVHHVEREVKGKALVAVKEESRLIHDQARERLSSMESEVQQRIQGVLDQARERFFEMIREEMDAIFGALETSLQGLLEDADIDVDPEAPGSAEDQAEVQWDKLGEPDAAPNGSQQLEGETTAEAPEQGAQHHEVRLEVPPPLDLKPLMGFYQGLLVMKDVRVIRTLGSVDKGVSVYIRPKQPSSLIHLLRALPGVSEVSDGTSGASVGNGKGGGEDNQPTLRILLTSTGK